MYAYRLAYDGRDYHGYQRQPTVATIEGAIFAALEHLEVPFEGGVPRGYSAAGRTDRGVSAISQTIALDAPDWLTPTVLSDAIGGAVAAWARATVSDDFDARYAAISRTYTYHLLRDELDERAVRQAIAALDGYHDFSNLTPDDRRTRRRVHLRVRDAGRWLVVQARARGFPRQLIRRIVSLAARIGRGEADLSAVGRVLSGEALPGHLGIEPAPPEPLCLATVRYFGPSFAPDTKAVEAARSTFQNRSDEAATIAEVLLAVTKGVDGEGL